MCFGMGDGTLALALLSLRRCCGKIRTRLSSPAKAGDPVSQRRWY
jgi:hypothetical protein